MEVRIQVKMSRKMLKGIGILYMDVSQYLYYNSKKMIRFSGFSVQVIYEGRTTFMPREEPRTC